MKVADAVAQVLKREGVDFLIGYPVNPIIEAAAVADIRTVIVRQERVGIHMADAVSRTTSGDKIGVFTMQHGPGTENAFGGVAQAWADSAPVVILPGGYPQAVAQLPAHFSAYLNYQNITKSAELVTRSEFTPHALRRAFSQARNGRPRPTLVEIPYDMLTSEFQGDLTYEPTHRVRYAPDPTSVDEVAGVLVAAERPVLYAGQGVHYAKAWPQLRELAELLEAPVTTSLQGKSAFPEDHPLSLGSGGNSLPLAVHKFVTDADVIFGIGCSFAATGYGIKFPPGKTIIHSTVDPNDLSLSLPISYGLVGDAALTLDMVLAAVRDRLGNKPRGRKDAVAAAIAATREEWLAQWKPKLTSDQVPMTPYRVIWDMLHTVDLDNTIITHDAGSPRDQMSPFWSSTTPLSYVGWGKSTQLGYGLGLMMGAKLAHPAKLCINVWGDAAIGFTGLDFETAVRERIPILSVLFNNFSMAIELKIMEVSTEKYRATDISGDYAAMARALGGYGERITTPDQIIPALRRGIAQTQNGTPALLEFITSKEVTVSTFGAGH